MQIDIEKILADLEPHLEEIASRVSALKPGGVTVVEFSVAIEGEGVGVPSAVHSAVFEAVAEATDVPIFVTGYRATRYGDRINVQLPLQAPSAPTAEDFA